jgi:hypothetical protein
MPTTVRASAAFFISLEGSRFHGRDQYALEGERKRIRSERVIVTLWR